MELSWHDPLAILAVILVLLLIWLLLRFLLKLAAKVFACGCAVILFIGLALALLSFLARQ